jgi:hypothetical protein
MYLGLPLCFSKQDLKIGAYFASLNGDANLLHWFLSIYIACLNTGRNSKSHCFRC